MEETKKVLRSLLVSSPMKISVERLNSDYKELMGDNIPYRQLGFRDIFSFLYAIPDVLSLNGNTWKSVVIPIVSEKTTHINDMVLKQKKNGKIGSFSKNVGPRFGQSRTNRNTFTRNINEPQHTYTASGKFANPSTQPQIQDHPLENGASKTVNNENYINKKVDTYQYLSIPIHSSTPKDSMKNDIMPAEKIIKKEDLHLLRRPNYHQTEDNNGPKIKSLMDVEIEGDFMRELLLKKDEYNRKYSKNVLPEVEVNNISDSRCRIPENIQDNLRFLISKFPDGVWCSELPFEYEKLFNIDLNYKYLGYRNLVDMCMDLHDIFVCSKESSCDYKLYDVRKPLIRPDIIQEGPSTSHKTPADLTRESQVKLDWNSCSLVLPPDVFRAGEEIKRDFISPSTKVGDVIKAVVAEVYDLSKFWLYRDSGELDSLMDDMQVFYKENDTKYLIPEYLLEIGLYCAIVTLNEFHRAVIIDMVKDTVKVYFIDYGSLGTAPKDKVWFLTKRYAELPAQAIRARLADIYPPFENMTWSKEARREFRNMVSMKKVLATIRNIQPNKMFVEVLLESALWPGECVNDILCSEGFALPTNKKRKMTIEDPHCTPRVNFIHLFPTFEEIEYWLVPSVENISTLSRLDVSPDLYMPQYFTRHVDKKSLDRIERKAEKICARREKLVKYLDGDKLTSMHSVEEMNRAFYGDSYDDFEKELNETSSANGGDEEIYDSDVEEWKFLNTLKRRIDKSDVAKHESGKSRMNQNYVKKATSKVSRDNDDIYSQFFGSDFVKERKSSKAASKCSSQQMSNLSSTYLRDLEKYLSEESSSDSDSVYSSKMANLDDDSSSDEQNLDFFKGNNSFSISDLSSNDGASNDNPTSSISKQTVKSSDSSSDLINLNVVLDCPIKNEPYTSRENCKEITTAVDPYESLMEKCCNNSWSNQFMGNEDLIGRIENDDKTRLDSPCNIRPGLVTNQKEFVERRKSPPKSVNISANVPQNSTALRPPPGFDPVPKYGMPFSVASTFYQPWSTNSMENLVINQRYFNQVASFYSMPPVVINYNYFSSAPAPSSNDKVNKK